MRMITLAAGPICVLKPGKSYQLPKAFARELIAGKAAVACEDRRATRPGKPDPQEPELLHDDLDDVLESE